MVGLDLLEQITNAAKAGKKFPNPAELAAAEQDRRTRDLYGNALSQATEGLENQLEDAIVGTADDIVTEHLRPALDEVMTEAVELVRILAPYGMAHEGLLQAPEEARQARVRFDFVVGRYRVLRDAQVELGALRDQPQREGGRYFEVRNRDTVAAGYRPGVVPWPTDDTLAKLVWFITNGAEVWMPTPAEREAAAVAADEAAKAASEVAA
jgi:hypothetical protein